MERGREEPDCGQNAGSLKELQAKPIKRNSVIWGWVCEESIQNENYMEGRTAKHFGRSLPIFFTYLLKIKVHHWAHEGYYSCLFVLRNFSFSFQNMNSSKMPEETLFLSRKAMIPEGMLPHCHSSVNSLDNFRVLLHWRTLCLPQALPWQEQEQCLGLTKPA